MKFGLSKDEYQFILENVVRPIHKQGGDVWCFGSRARNDHQKYSDLDLMVSTAEPVPTLVSQLIEKVSNSNFPYKLDLVEEHAFASSYRKNYEKEKVLFEACI